MTRAKGLQAGRSTPMQQTLRDCGPSETSRAVARSKVLRVTGELEAQIKARDEAQGMVAVNDAIIHELE